MMGGMRPDPQQMFNRMDKNGSAGIDKDELSAMTEKMAEASGTEIDAVSLVEEYNGDEDGILNQDETHAAMESLKAQLGPPAKSHLMIRYQFVFLFSIGLFIQR